MYIYVCVFHVPQCVACWNVMYSNVLCQKWRIKHVQSINQSIYSLSGKTSYRQISWSLEAVRLCYNDRIDLTFGRHLGSAAAEVPVKFQSDRESLNLRLRDFTRSYGKTCVRLVNKGPGDRSELGKQAVPSVTLFKYATFEITQWDIWLHIK